MCEKFLRKLVTGKVTMILLENNTGTYTLLFKNMESHTNKNVIVHVFFCKRRILTKFSK